MVQPLAGIPCLHTIDVNSTPARPHAPQVPSRHFFLTGTECIHLFRVNHQPRFCNTPRVPCQALRSTPPQAAGRTHVAYVLPSTPPRYGLHSLKKIPLPKKEKKLGRLGYKVCLRGTPRSIVNAIQIASQSSICIRMSFEHSATHASQHSLLRPVLLTPHTCCYNSFLHAVAYAPPHLYFESLNKQKQYQCTGRR